MRRKLRRKEIKIRNQKILLSSLLILCLLSVGYGAFQTTLILNATGVIKKISNIYVSSSGSDTEGDGSKENPFQTIEKAYEEATKTATIYLITDIRPSKQIVFNKEKTITITSYKNTLNNHQIIKDENYNSTVGGWMIKLTKGKLVLKDLTLYGSDIEQSGGALHGDNNTQIELLKGTTISNFKNTTTYGSAVRIEPSNETYIQNDYNLIIDGAIIRDNSTKHSGGGIYISYKSLGIVKSGEIINNYASNDGGGIIVLGKLDLYDGKISNNVAEGSGGAIATQYHIQDEIEYAGEINMYGNIAISQNTSNMNCGAIFINKKGKLNMNGGIISHNNATTSVGGVYKHENGIFNYNSGIICENTPSNEYETHEVCPN